MIIMFLEWCGLEEVTKFSVINQKLHFGCFWNIHFFNEKKSNP